MTKSEIATLEKNMNNVIAFFSQNEDQNLKPEFIFYGSGAWNIVIDPNTKPSFHYSFIGLRQRLRNLECEPVFADSNIIESEKIACDVFEKELGPLMKEISSGEKYKESYILFNGRWQFLHNNVFYNPKSYGELKVRLIKTLEKRCLPV